MSRSLLKLPQTTSLLLGCALVALLFSGLTPSAAQSRTVASDKDPKTHSSLASGQRSTFDCTGRDTLDIAPLFQMEIPDSTTASENIHSSYACRTWDESGPENIYRLEVTSPVELFAGLRGFDDPSGPVVSDLDIFLLSHCDTDSCIISGNTEITAELDPGTFYLVVDGFDGAAGKFTLLLEGRELGVPLSICTPEGSTAINPQDDLTSVTDNIFGQPDLVQAYDCSSIVERGGELWYAVTINPYHEFTITTTILSPSLDAALWLFDGCGPFAECLEFADENVAGESESLTWANDTEETITVYLGYDCYRAPETEALGEVTLEFSGASNVSAESKSMGSVRSLFR